MNDPMSKFTTQKAASDNPELQTLARVLKDKYVIDRELGRGGFGAVFKARDVMLERDVAIKLIFPYLAQRREFVQRFLREVKLAARLNHPNIVTIYQIGSEGSLYFFIMELVNGPNIEQRVRDEGVFSPAETWRVGRELLAALAHAHERDVPHHNVKPTNVLLNGQGHPLITDFGLAKAAADAGTSSADLVLENPHFVAPEQLAGEPVDLRADQFSVMSLLYYMLTGKLPYTSGPALPDRPQPLQQLITGLDPAFEAIIMKGLSRSLNDRFPAIARVLTAWESLDSSKLPDRVRLSQPSQSIENTDGDTAARLYHQALASFRDRDYDRAIELWEQVLAHDSSHLDALSYLEQAKLKKQDQKRIRQFVAEGNQRFQAGKYAEAIRVWSRILALDSSNQEALDLINRARAEKERTQRAEHFYQEGQGHFERREYAEALKTWGKVLSIHEGYKDVVEKIGIAHTAIKQQRDLDLRTERAGRLLEQGNTDQARHELQAVLAIDPEHLRARKYWAKLAKDDEQQQMIDSLLTEGESLLSEGELELAWETAQMLLELSPANSRVTAFAAKINSTKESREQMAELRKEAGSAFQRKDYHTALNVLRRLETLLPGDQEVVAGIKLSQEKLLAQETSLDLVQEARRLLSKKQDGDALQKLGQAADLSPDNAEIAAEFEHLKNRLAQDQRTESLATQAAQALDAGRYDLTIRLATELLRIDDKNRRGRKLLTQAQEEMKTRGMEPLTTLLRRARARVRQQELKEALQIYRTVLERDPENAEALRGIEDIESSKQELPEQEKLMQEAKAALSKADYPHALEILARLQQIAPEYPGLKKMIERTAAKIGTPEQMEDTDSFDAFVFPETKDPTPTISVADVSAPVPSRAEVFRPESRKLWPLLVGAAAALLLLVIAAVLLVPHFSKPDKTVITPPPKDERIVGLLNQAREKMSRHDFSGAQTDVQQALESDPENPDARRLEVHIERLLKLSSEGALPSGTNEKPK